MSLSSKTIIESREWSKFFPTDINTQYGSCLFIQRLFTVTLSSLTARRNIFSADHFSSKTLGPLVVPLFTRPTSMAEQERFNSTVFSWIQGISHAISNNYLKLATFFIISKVDDSIFEIYEYYFDYNNVESNSPNESFLSTISNDEIQQQVLKVLKQLEQFIDERLDPIVNRKNYRFCLKIQYNTLITPDDYQPTGFVDSNNIISPINWKAILTTKVTSSRRIIAQIKTTYHKMLIVYRTPTMNSTLDN